MTSQLGPEGATDLTSYTAVLAVAPCCRKRASPTSGSLAVVTSTCLLSTTTSAVRVPVLPLGALTGRSVKIALYSPPVVVVPSQSAPAEPQIMLLDGMAGLPAKG